MSSWSQAKMDEMWNRTRLRNIVNNVRYEQTCSHNASAFGSTLHSNLRCV